MLIKLFGIAMAALLLAGCLGGVGSSGTGTVALHLGDSNSEPVESSSLVLQALEASDADPESIAELWITFKSIEVRRNGGWKTLATVESENQKVDLMSLRFQPLFMGSNQSVTTGTYSDVRLTTSDEDGAHKIVLVDDSEHALKIPSNELKPHVAGFVVREDAVTQLVMDVNPHYVVERGQSGQGYNLNPVHAVQLLHMSELAEVTFSWTLPGSYEFDIITFTLYAADDTDRDEPLLTLTWAELTESVVLAGMRPGNYQAQLILETGEDTSLEASQDFTVAAEEIKDVDLDFSTDTNE